MRDTTELNLEHRSLPVSYNPETDTISVIFSTGERTLRRGLSGEHYEELEISERAIDFTRLQNGAPVLDNHIRNSVRDIIGVVENAGIDEGKATAVIRFSERAKDIADDVKNGIIKNLSMGYLPKKLVKVGEENRKPVLRATEWEPFEISLVPIPVDKYAQTRALILENTKMENQEMTEIVENLETKETVTTETRALPEIDTTELLKAERERVNQILLAVRSAKLDESVAMDLINRSLTPEQARSELFGRIVANQPTVIANTANISITEDAKDKRTRAIEQTLLHRVGFDADDSANEYRSYTMFEIASTFVENRTGLDKLGLMTRALSTSDLPLLLSNVANKSLQNGFDTAPETWNKWTRVVSLSDFKAYDIHALSEAANLEDVSNGKEYKYGGLSEKKESVQLGTFGRLLQVTREALINDDLSALSDIPRMMGRAAARKIGDVVYAVLTANANLSDNIALFEASAHKNLVASNGALNVANIDNAKKLMALQKDISGVATLNIRPAYFIGPVALESSALVAIQSQFDHDGTKLQRPNPVMNLAEVVTDARLDGSPTTWYLAASPKVHDTVVVAFLNGNQKPLLEQETGFNRDGLTFKVRIDVAAKAVDYRGLVKSVG